MGYTFDTCYLIDLVRENLSAVEKAEQVEATGEDKVVSTPVLFELMSGLLYRRSRTETNRIRRIVSRFQVVSFDEPSTRKAAEIQSELMRMGRRSSNVDVMIAGIAAQHGHILITRDKNLAELETGIPLDVESY